MCGVGLVWALVSCKVLFSFILYLFFLFYALVLRIDRFWIGYFEYLGDSLNGVRGG